MKDGKPNHASEPDYRRASAGRKGGGPARQRGFVQHPMNRASPETFVERATMHGHSGHGSESVRPHLRDQLKLKALLPTPFPMPENEHGKDDHHL